MKPRTFRIDKKGKTLSASLYKDAHGVEGVMITFGVDGKSSSMVLSIREADALAGDLDVILDVLEGVE